MLCGGLAVYESGGGIIRGLHTAKAASVVEFARLESQPRGVALLERVRDFHTSDFKRSAVQMSQSSRAGGRPFIEVLLASRNHRLRQRFWISHQLAWNRYLLAYLEHCVRATTISARQKSCVI